LYQVTISPHFDPLVSLSGCITLQAFLQFVSKLPPLNLQLFLINFELNGMTWYKLSFPSGEPLFSEDKHLPDLQTARINARCNITGKFLTLTLSDMQLVCFPLNAVRSL
jgi:hypothetical protein